MKKKPLLILVMAALLILTLGQTVSAFSDIKNDPNEQKIDALQKQGILNGEKDGKFNSKGKLTYASGISMLVKGFGLNIDNLRFVKAPKVTDYYTNLKDDTWYSDAIIIAHYNGLDIPKDVKAEDEMTREQFAHHLFKAIAKQGDYAFIEMFMLINDEKDVNADYMDSIQKLLISKIATLDEKQNFYPTKAITRGDAAAWLHDGLAFVNDTPPVTTQEHPNLNLKLDITAVNNEVNKVTITGQAPHPGYGLRITSINFEDGQAVIHVETVQPDPDKMYPQVITDVQVVTYVDAALKPVLFSPDQPISSSAE